MRKLRAPTYSIRRRLRAVFKHQMQIYTEQRMTPVVEWCREQFGPGLVEQFKARRGFDDTVFRAYLQYWEFTETDLSAARWEYNDCFVFFKNENDAILFRLAWQCRAEIT